MYTRYITSEEKIIIEEARKIIKRGKKRNRENILSKAKQKLIGLGLISISIVIPVLLDDATASCILFPLGVGALLSKESVIG